VAVAVAASAATTEMMENCILVWRVVVVVLKCGCVYRLRIEECDDRLGW
jgi:hypothetical protein